MVENVSSITVSNPSGSASFEVLRNLFIQTNQQSVIAQLGKLNDVGSLLLAFEDRELQRVFTASLTAANKAVQQTIVELPRGTELQALLKFESNRVSLLTERLQAPASSAVINEAQRRLITQWLNTPKPIIEFKLVSPTLLADSSLKIQSNPVSLSQVITSTSSQTPKQPSLESQNIESTKTPEKPISQSSNTAVTPELKSESKPRQIQSPSTLIAPPETEKLTLADRNRTEQLSPLNKLLAQMINRWRELVSSVPAPASTAKSPPTNPTEQQTTQTQIAQNSLQTLTTGALKAGASPSTPAAPSIQQLGTNDIINKLDKQTNETIKASSSSLTRALTALRQLSPELLSKNSAELRSNIDLWLKQIPSATSLKAGEIKQQLTLSGLFSERNQLAKMSLSEPLTTAINSLPEGRSREQFVSLLTVARQLVPMTSQLASSEVLDLKTLLASSAAELSDSTALSQTDRPIPRNSFLLALPAFLRGFRNRLSNKSGDSHPTVSASTKSDTLALIESAIARITWQQSQSIAAESHSPAQWHFDLPVSFNQKLHWLSMSIEQEPPHHEQPEIKRLWKVTVRFELAGLGNLNVIIRTQNNRAELTFTADSTATQALIEQSVGEFSNQLAALGIDVSKIHHHGSDQETKQSSSSSNKSNHQVDTRV